VVRVRAAVSDVRELKLGAVRELKLDAVRELKLDAVRELKLGLHPICEFENLNLLSASSNFSERIIGPAVETQDVHQTKLGAQHEGPARHRRHIVAVNVAVNGLEVAAHRATTSVAGSSGDIAKVGDERGRWEAVRLRCGHRGRMISEFK
jgi:hypothetical protein